MLNIKCFFEFQSFDYSSIFSYEVPKDEVKFKSVFKFEELSRKNYEADYYKVSFSSLLRVGDRTSPNYI